MRLWHEGHFEHLSQFLTLNQRFHIYHSDAYAKQYSKFQNKILTLTWNFFSEFYKLNYTEFQPPYIRLSMTFGLELEFSCVSSDLCEKFTGDALLLKRPRKSLKVLTFSSKEASSSLISLEMIIKVLQYEFNRLNFYVLNSKMLKIPEFNLTIHAFMILKKKKLSWVWKWS